jgi:hypothetical protein
VDHRHHGHRPRLTPSFKIKGRGTEANFAGEIDKMYEGTVVT